MKSRQWIIPLLVAVLLLRAVLRRAPKWTVVLLWGLVALRLCWPFSWQSAWSLLPSSQTISPDILMDPSPSIHSSGVAMSATSNVRFLSNSCPGWA